MIPSHLSALPCGSCRQPTSTLTLRRIDKKFLCPDCHERTTTDAQVQKPVEAAPMVSEKAWKWLLRTRKAISLGVLALFVTGFVVLPALIDPAEAAAYSIRSAQARHSEQNLDANRAS